MTIAFSGTEMLGQHCRIANMRGCSAVAGVIDSIVGISWCGAAEDQQNYNSTRGGPVCMGLFAALKQSKIRFYKLGE